MRHRIELPPVIDVGQVLAAVDSDLNTLLELGFQSPIQKEWECRVSRGESLKNLQAFAHLIDDDGWDGGNDRAN
jgi:hypothetical protein